MNYIIPIKVVTKWRLKDNHKYEWTTCKRLINTQTMRFIKKTFNGKGVQRGYFIDGDFLKISEMKEGGLIELLPKIMYTPFD